IGENLAGDAMRRAFERLYGKIRPGSVALIFFSGFGIQSNRQSYLIPVDAQIWTEQDVRHDGFSLETVLGEINARGAGVKIALIDASRRNPYERRFRTFSAGLAPVIAPNGTLVMYSAALSSVISDNGGGHSLFVQELLKEIRVPDLMAGETLNRTPVGGTPASRGEQAPRISSSPAQGFSFIPGASAGRPPPAAGPAPGRDRRSAPSAPAAGGKHDAIAVTDAGCGCTTAASPAAASGRDPLALAATSPAAAGRSSDAGTGIALANPGRPGG